MNEYAKSSLSQQIILKSLKMLINVYATIKKELNGSQTFLD